ncbi:MAG: imidazolonepropionase [Gammaproteobacteria bacterium]|nr:imidazolonepropionase [Gammaproteobacteria bacterium]
MPASHDKACELLVHNARIHPCVTDGKIASETNFTVRGGRIAAIGVDDAVPAHERFDAKGALLLPGFVDCHTHLCYAGNRMDEHAARLEGASYAGIAKRGGGIHSTVAAVAAASEDELIAESLPRLEALVAEGATTVEIKSGYGLTPENELKQLRAIRRLGELSPARIVPTFLALHALPANADRKRYVKTVIEETLPAVVEEKLADCVDVFCEHMAFTVEEMRAVFERARELGLACRAHSDQLSNLGGTRAAAGLSARSCDHLEYSQDADVQALADTGAVAVLLPGAFYFLREKQLPPIDALRKAGVPIAIASDLNPGTSPIASPLAVLHLASTLFRLTPEEALLGLTRHGAAALALEEKVGGLAVGRRADFTLWDIPGPEFFCYQLGGIQPHAVYIEGKAYVADKFSPRHSRVGGNPV